MKIYFDRNQQPEQPKVYLGTPNHQIICALNGIDEDSFSLTPNLNNTYELSFDLNRYISIIGRQVESNAYNLVDILMRLYVSNIGWFVIQTPTINNNGIKETKSIKAESAEIELVQHDIKNLKINKGTTDSYEMLVNGNVEIIDDVEFAKEQIKFYNRNKPELSFLDILMKVSGLYGWEIGFIDDIPKTYQYYENGELKERKVKLSEEIGSFEIESQDLYSFLTQTVSQYFSCIFIFDFKNFKINVYRPENLGKDTNINIGFRNLQQSNEISVDKDNIFTRYNVSGADDLGITYVNFGSNQIENLDYFLNEKYMSAELIKKYKLWRSDVETYRIEYIENTRLYNAQQNVISELYNRLPLDGCSTDWSTFEDSKLFEAQANYQAQLKGYESFYVDSDGNFDKSALDASIDANDYYQIKDVILPSIQIEIDNRELPTDDDKIDYIDSYKTDWKLYGLDELQVKLDTYINTKNVCESGGYNIPYSPDSGHTEDYHNQMYNKYLDAINQLNPNFIGSCQEAYDKRKQEIDNATALLNQYDEVRKQCTKNVEKETWVNHNSEVFLTDENNSAEGIYFTSEDLECLSHLYIDTDYTNQYMFLTSSDDSVSAIDEQLKLLSAAQDELSIYSQPQYTYTTSLDNFLAKYEYQNYIDNLNLGDFMYLGIRDDYVVKLRVISMQYNPMKMNNNLQITFSNMLKSKSDRYDYPYLLNSSSNTGKNTTSGSSGNYVTNEGIGLTSGLIQKLVSSGVFSNQVNQFINNELAGYIGNFITVDGLNSEMIKVTNITGENGFFEYLQSKLISTDKIVAGSGEFTELSSLVSKIDNLLAGDITAEDFHALHMTINNAVIDDAVIAELIAAKITVDMLASGTINTNKFNVQSPDGGLSIVGNTMQFRDKDGNVRIQIGRDAKNEFTFTLYDKTGTGILIDSTGIKDSAIADGTIKTDMIADKAITGSKIDKTGMTEWTDDNGNKIFDVSNMYYGNDKFSVSYTSTVDKINETYNRVDDIASKIGTIELMGGQIFKQIQGVVTPESITVTAVSRNGATIGDWYINNVINTEYVSADKNSITIPSAYMLLNNIVQIKVTDSTGNLYDLHTLYLISDSTGATGQAAISVIITSDKGTTFNENTSISKTTCTCTVYEGVNEITPKSYNWLAIYNDTGTWTSIGTTKSIIVNIDKEIIRKRLKCEVDIDV